MTADLATDLRTRWTPSESQISDAVAALSTYPAEIRDRLFYMAPIVLRNKRPDFWTLDVVVEPCEGTGYVGFNGNEEPPVYTLPYHTATGRAAAIAADRIEKGETATPSYATISADGTWAVWEADWML